ncbi:kanadaptin isoform X2 [Xenopus laevis]|uniref:Kanadaptin isoform X2 n=1 Tax=Xenopus laevis TaxID=8355 RepID=A0A8J1KS44_XENLA|nr:kanadaptin isoform X2 [Xenopus laevis]
METPPLVPDGGKLCSHPVAAALEDTGGPGSQNNGQGDSAESRGTSGSEEPRSTGGTADTDTNEAHSPKTKIIESIGGSSEEDRSPGDGASEESDTCGPRGSEGTGDVCAGSFEGTGDTGEGLGAQTQTQRTSRSSQGPLVTQSNEGRGPSRWTNEDESVNTTGSHSPEESSSPRGITPGKQQSPQPSYVEFTSRSPSNEGTSAFSPPREKPTVTESFKKPMFCARPSDTKKATEPRDKPVAQSQPSPPACNRTPSAETPPAGSARLPSDAYQTCPAIPYREPVWSGLPQTLYNLEILKGGNIVSTKNLSNVSWTLFGRLPSCHVSLEHPSVSRYHAVLQYRHIQGSDPDEELGFYVYDLGSTHGTFLNKQRIQAKTYCRVKVGHVLKFGGSTRLFILQGPEEDQEEESELTVTQIKEARRQRESLQKKMLGDDSDDEESSEDNKNVKDPGSLGDDGGCMWGMGEDALQEDNEENPIATEFQEQKEALYLKNPKKALQGFFDREGEELEYEYEEQGPGMWLCRVKLPVDDASGKQVVAEAVHSGRKKEASVVCSLEACRMLEMRGLLRQEAVARKRKAKNWEDEDFYDSDDDTFLDRTGLVERKRLNRMKKAGKIEDKPETYDSLVAKLNAVEKELSDIAIKLQTSHAADSQSKAQDSLDAFMTEIKSGATLDNVARKKLHLRSFELKKEQQRLKGLIKIVQPTKLPELSPVAPDPKAKKPSLPMFGAMKGGRKFKLKTGTVGKLPPKRTDLPESFFNMKGDENEEEEEEEEMQVECKQITEDSSEKPAQREEADKGSPQKTACSPQSSAVDKPVPEMEDKLPHLGPKKTKDSEPDDETPIPSKREPQVSQKEENKQKEETVKPRKMHGPSRPPTGSLSTHYPKDDPDYCVWMPPTGQTGDGKTHLNEKYGY